MTLCGVLALGCGGARTPGADGGGDASGAVDGAQGRRDGRGDAWREAGRTDALRDAQYGEGIGDIGTVDAALSAGTALYVVTSDSDAFGLRTVSTDGRGTPAPVPGFAGLVDFDGLRLASLHGLLPVRRDLARPDGEGPFRGIRLPGTLGTLYYFHRKLTGTSGLLVITPGGILRVVHEAAGVYADTLAEHVALSLDGRVGVAAQKGDRVVLFRTDGQPLPGGGSSLVLPSAVAVSSLQARSLTVVGGWLYVVGQTDRGAATLLRAPLTGAAPLEEVLVSRARGRASAWIGDQLAVSEDESRLLVPAGANAGAADLFVVEVATGLARRVTPSAGSLAPRGEVFGAEGGQLALSPTGKALAYVKEVQGKPELFVAPTQVGGATAQLSDPGRFKDAVVAFVNLWFPDDATLLFMAGAGPGRMDLYRWELTSGRLANLTGYGSIKAPFDGAGRFAPRGAWTSPGRTHFYWIEQDSLTGARDLRGLRLPGGTPFPVTSQAYVASTGGSFVHCAASGDLYFVAQPRVAIYQEEVFHLRLEQGGSATRLTSLAHPSGASWIVRDLTLTEDCGTLVFSAGGHPELRYLWRLSPPSAGPARAFTAVPRYVADTLRFTADGQTVVHASGGAVDRTTLKAVQLGGGTPTTLDPQGGVVHLFAVY
ncbi:MAG: hypothetical protein IT371_02680 [Deltaproteobacteria bacterium]|nr:hypothetical protein [Deltaproteobacteria bacterium]